MNNSHQFESGVKEFTIEIQINSQIKDNLLDYVNSGGYDDSTSFITIAGGGMNIIIDGRSIFKLKVDRESEKKYATSWLGYTLMHFLESIIEIKHNKSKVEIDFTDNGNVKLYVGWIGDGKLRIQTKPSEIVMERNEIISFIEYESQILKAAREYLKIIKKIAPFLWEFRGAQRDIQMFEKLIKNA